MSGNCSPDQPRTFTDTAQHDGMTVLGRRALLTSTAGVALSGIAPRAGAASILVRERLTLPSGV